MNGIEHEGKVYCDWRVNITNCEESSFFKWVYLYGALAASIAWLLFFACLFVRKVLIGEPWKGFLRGDNVSNCFFLVSIGCVIGHFLLLLLGAPPVLNGVYWTLLAPIKAFHMSFVTELLLNSIPKTLVTGESSFLNERTRPRILYSLVAILTVTNVVLVSTSFHFLDVGQTSLGLVLRKVGLTISALCVVSICGILSYGSFKLFFKIKRVFAEINHFEATHGENENSLLLLASRKLAFGGTWAIFNGIFDGLYLLLLALYPSFFTNLGVSKAFVITLNAVNFTICSLFALLFFIVDIKSWLFREETSANASSKKKASTLPQNSLVKEEGIEMVIEDLRPKSVDLTT